MYEREIHNLFSKIKVNPDKTAEYVMKNLQNAQQEAANPPRFANKRILLIAAVLSALLISTTAFAFTGGFENFLRRVEPPFAEIIQPIMYYAEDGGIRLTVYGAQNFGHSAIIYLSMRDISGENRLSQYSFIDINFRANIDWQPYEGFRHLRYVQPIGRSLAPLHFCEETGTKYIQIMLSYSEPLPADLTLSFSYIIPDTNSPQRNDAVHGIRHTDIIEGNWQVAAHLEAAQIITAKDGQTITLTGEGYLLNFEGYIIEEITLSPLGIQIVSYGQRLFAHDCTDVVYIWQDGHYRASWFPGEYEPRLEYIPAGYQRVDRSMINERRIFGNIYIETESGLINTIYMRVSSSTDNNRRTLNRWADEPLDLDSITAVIIDGKRIEIPIIINGQSIRLTGEEYLLNVEDFTIISEVLLTPLGIQLTIYESYYCPDCPDVVYKWEELGFYAYASSWYPGEYTPRDGERIYIPSEYRRMHRSSYVSGRVHRSIYLETESGLFNTIYMRSASTTTDSRRVIKRFADEPLDLDSITAVIIDGNRFEIARD